MPPSFKITLKISSPEVFRGESNFFETSVKNDGSEPAAGVRAFVGDGGGLTILVTPLGAVAPSSSELAAPKVPGQLIAGSKSFEEREGVHRHGPEGQSDATLAPGAQWTAKGDLLEWFGEIAPGSYTVTARYNSGYDTVESPPVPLKVLVIKPLLGGVARHGERHFSGRPTAAMVHSGPDGKLTFAQVQSEALPRTPYRGIRLAGAGEPTELCPASAAVASVPNTHVLIGDGKGWKIGTAPLNGQPAKVADLQSPIPGRVLASPLSLSDGGLAVPFVSADGKRCFVLRYGPDGALTVAPEIPLGKGTPLGLHACCWQQESALHLFWSAAEGGREVWHASQSVDDGGAPCVVHSVFIAPDPVMWLDAWSDVNESLRSRPGFGVPGDAKGGDAVAPLKLKVWCVTQRAKQLTCTEYNVADMTQRVGGTFQLQDESPLRVLSSAIRPDGQLCLLLAGAGKELHYASTAAKKCAPLKDWIHKAVTIDQSPGVFAASGRATLPWVYLRHLDAGEGKACFTLLEPVGEEDPSHEGHGH